MLLWLFYFNYSTLVHREASRLRRGLGLEQRVTTLEMDLLDPATAPRLTPAGRGRQGRRGHAHPSLPIACRLGDHNCVRTVHRQEATALNWGLSWRV
jgi:hypothetical protein